LIKRAFVRFVSKLAHLDQELLLLLRLIKEKGQLTVLEGEGSKIVESRAERLGVSTIPNSNGRVPCAVVHPNLSCETQSLCRTVVGLFDALKVTEFQFSNSSFTSLYTPFKWLATSSKTRLSLRFQNYFPF
jgi:hypothetical protein